MNEFKFRDLLAFPFYALGLWILLPLSFLIGGKWTSESFLQSIGHMHKGFQKTVDQIIN